MVGAAPQQAVMLDAGVGNVGGNDAGGSFARTPTAVGHARQKKVRKRGSTERPSLILQRSPAAGLLLGSRAPPTGSATSEGLPPLVVADGAVPPYASGVEG